MKFYKIIGLASVVSLLLLTGCATATDPKAMAVTDIAITNKHEGGVSVVTSGGSETSSMGSSKISNEDLKVAIETSITETGLFDRIAVEDNEDYTLTAYITELNQPSMGFSFTVKLEMAWSLKKLGDSNAVWEKLIRSEHTTGAGEAFAGVTRLRMATEGAVKNNIQTAISELTQLEL